MLALCLCAAIAPSRLLDQFDACELIGPDPHERYPSDEARQVVADAVFDAFIEYQQQIYQKAEAEDACVDVPAIVFKAVAGIGDTMESLIWTFRHALNTGRVFFVDWRMPLKSGPDQFFAGNYLDWSHGIAPITSRSGTELQWDYWQAQKTRRICSDVIHAEGQTFEGDDYKGLVQEQCKTWGDRGYFLTEAHYLSRFFRPSALVRDAMQPILTQLQGHLTMSMQIRTTKRLDVENSWEHLVGDHHNFDRFVQCVRSAMRLKDPERQLKVFLATDDPEAVQHIHAQPDLHGVIVYNDGPISHTVGPSHGRKGSREGVIKAFADFFLLGEVEVALTTANSRFGTASVERSSEIKRHYLINHEHCDQPPVIMPCQPASVSQDYDGVLQCDANLVTYVTKDSGPNPFRFGSRTEL